MKPRSIYKIMLFVIIYLFVQTQGAFSQSSGWVKISRVKYGFQMNAVMNGSGHGLLATGELVLHVNKSEFNAGIFSQTHFQNISGALAQYKYLLTNGNYTNIYAHYTFMFHYQNVLSDNLNKIIHPQDYSENATYEKFNTMSHQLGIGLQTALTKNINFDIRIGIGAYFSNVVGPDTRNKNINIRPDNEFAASIAAGIAYKISGKTKKQRFGKY